MAFTLIQSGTSLQLLDPLGNIATVSLPTNITLSAVRTPRFAVFEKYVVVVNSPNRPITIDAFGIARVLTPAPPAATPVASAESGGTLSGTYRVKQTYRIKDTFGNIISESGFSAPSNSVSLTTQWLRAASLALSPDAVSSSMLYRTLTTGSVYFPWVELDGNTQTSIQDDLSDAGISLVAADALGSAPDLTLIAEWRGRLWGADRVNFDNIYWTETGKMYAWNPANFQPVPKVGSDERGITALIARKEALIIGRQNIIHSMVGNSSSDFRLIKLTDNCGIESQESCANYIDTSYWLWKDGVYELGPSNVVKCISDGKVRSWFTTDTYFNRAQFKNAKGQILPGRKVYRLFLCAAGSSTIDRFVDYEIASGTWWGPHTITGLTPTCTLIRPDADDVLVPSVGMSSGRLYQETTTRTDDTATAIDLSIDTKRHDLGTPTVQKVWKDLTVAQVPLSTGRMTVTPSVGELDAAASTQVLQADLTLGRQRLGRLGMGMSAKLNFREATVGQDVKLLGYEIDVHEAGDR